MNPKRLAFTFLILIALSCNTVTQALVGTPTPAPTQTLIPTGVPIPTTLSEPTATPEVVPTETTPAANNDLFASVYIPPSCENKPIATVSPDSIATQAT